MAAPVWLSGVFAAVMLAITVYCAGRLIAAAAWRRESELDADGMHLFMGAAMAGALAPELSVVTPGVWETVFAVTAAWFAGQVVRVRRGDSAGRWRCPHPVPHLAESLAMVYMLAAARAPAPGGGNTGAAMPGMGAVAGMARFPVVAVMLALFMVGYVAWLGDRLISVSRPAATPALQAARRRAVLAPRAATCYKIAMGITMAYMLIIMV